MENTKPMQVKDEDEDENSCLASQKGTLFVRGRADQQARSRCCGDPRPCLSHRLLGLEVALSSGSVWISRLLAGTHDREYSPVSRMIDIVSTTPSFKIHTDFEV